MDNSYNSQNPNLLSKQRPSSNNALYAIAGIVVVIIIVLILVIIGVIPISSSGSTNGSPGTPGTSSSSAGASGSKGAPGPPGPPGIQGIQGIQGLIGLRGPPVKVIINTFYLPIYAHGNTGSKWIEFKKETNNGYFIVLCPQNNQICVYNYSNGVITTLFGSRNGGGFDNGVNYGNNIKIWYNHLNDHTAHLIAHWWD
jgi:hypothetical protein